MKLLPHLPSPSPRVLGCARHDPRRVTCHGQFPRRAWRRGDVRHFTRDYLLAELRRTRGVSSHGAGAMSHSTGGSDTPYIVVPGLRATALYTLFCYYLVCFNPLIDYFNILSTNYGYNSGLSFTKCKGTPIYFKNLIYYNEERPFKVMRSLQSHLKKERRILTLTTHNSRLISQEAGQGDLRCIRRFQEDKRSYKCYDLDRSQRVYENEV